MTHFVRTQLDATWTTGNYVPSIADWTSLDAKVFAAVNGDNGGTWAPSTPIIVNGTGAPLGYVDVSGPVVIDYGGSLTLTNPSTAPIRLGPAYFPEFAVGHALRTRSIPTSCLERMGTFARWHFRTVENALYTAVQGSNIVAAAASGVARYPGFVLPLRVHDGARLGQVRLTFRVPTPRTLKPYQVPQVRVVRADVNGNLVPLQSHVAGAANDGYVPIGAPTSGPAWFNLGDVQTLTYVCDQNNVVDVSQYTYYLQVVEEQGAPGTAPDGAILLEQKANVRVVATAAILLSGSATIDGVALATGDRVLTAGQSSGIGNSIWIVNTGGSWTAAADVSTAASLTPNFIVLVSEGAVHRGEVWQYGGFAPATGTTFLRQAAGYLSGNVFHAAICDFDSITDMRFQ